MANFMPHILQLCSLVESPEMFLQCVEKWVLVEVFFLFWQMIWTWFTFMIWWVNIASLSFFSVVNNFPLYAILWSIIEQVLVWHMSFSWMTFSALVHADGDSFKPYPITPSSYTFLNSENNEFYFHKLFHHLLLHFQGWHCNFTSNGHAWNICECSSFNFLFCWTWYMCCHALWFQNFSTVIWCIRNALLW